MLPKMKINSLLLICILFITLLNYSKSCYSNCDTCVCIGTCFSKHCTGVGTGCQCVGIIKDENSLIISSIIEDLCQKVNNMTIPFVLPIKNEIGKGFELDCKDGKIGGYIV